MTRADRVLSTPRKTAFKIIAGTDFAHPLSDATAPSPVQLRFEPITDDKPSAEILTPTHKNKRLRGRRRDAWRDAERVTQYWRTRLDFEDALLWAQRAELPEGNYHPLVDSKDRYPMVGRYREALVKQLLTPAPDAASVAWKKAALARGQHCHIGVKSERIERAIADDVAWLAAHPFRIKPRAGVS